MLSLGSTFPARSKSANHHLFLVIVSVLLNSPFHCYRIKKGASLKSKVCATRKKSSPAATPATPAPKNPADRGARTSAAGPILGRASIIPPTQWTEMAGKEKAPPSPLRAEAPADDAPAFPPIKAEAFDAEGYIKSEFMSRFLRVPPVPRKKGTTVRDDEPDQTKAYDTLDVIEILEIGRASCRERVYVLV